MVNMRCQSQYLPLKWVHHCGWKVWLEVQSLSHFLYVHVKERCSEESQGGAESFYSEVMQMLGFEKDVLHAQIKNR